MSSSSTSETETVHAHDILQDIIDQLDELLAPMHFLDDLNAVWDKLSEEERKQIESSRVYQDNDHDQRIQTGLNELKELSESLRGFKYRGIRKSIRQYATHWKSFEPDQVKILQAQIKQALNT